MIFTMDIAIILILLFLLFGGLGFAIHLLWIVAVVFLILALVNRLGGRNSRL